MMYRYINVVIVVCALHELSRENTYSCVNHDEWCTSRRHVSGDDQPRPSWSAQRCAGDDLGWQNDVERPGVQLAQADRLDVLYQHFDGPPSDLVRRLAHRCQVYPAGYQVMVVANDGDVVGHAQPMRAQRLYAADRPRLGASEHRLGQRLATATQQPLLHRFAAT